MSVQVGNVLGYKAASAFGAKLAVVLDAVEHKVKLPTAANQRIAGISLDAGDPADVKKVRVRVVRQGDEALVTMAANCSEGDRLKVAGVSGKLTPVDLAAETAGTRVNVVAIARGDNTLGDGAVIPAVVTEEELFVETIGETAELPGDEAGAAANYGVVFLADKACQLEAVTGRWETAAGATATLMVKKVPSGTAPASGTDMLSAGMDLEAAANTNLAGALHGTTANLQLAAGDAVALVPTGTVTAVAGLAVRLRFRAL